MDYKGESHLNRAPVVYKQTGIGVQINTLQTQGVEIILIQCCQSPDAQNASG